VSKANPTPKLAKSFGNRGCCAFILKFLISRIKAASQTLGPISTAAPLSKAQAAFIASWFYGVAVTLSKVAGHKVPSL
jgi:hypothetical protein